MLKEYIKLRFVLILFFLLVILLFPLLDYLHGNKMEGVLYGVELLTLLFAVFGVFDFFFFCKKHKAFQRSIQQGNVEDLLLPRAYGLIEEDYEAVIRQLVYKHREAFRSINAKNDARLDYFTLWIHQIKTPISALDLLLQSGGGQNDGRAAMEQELFRISQYADMVLAYLRMDTLSNDLELVECDLNKIVKELVKKYAALFIYKGIAIKLEELPYKVLSDEKWLSLMIEQLLSNAVKYTSKGFVHIHMSENPLSLFVEDTGIGIRKEDEKRIFERGFTGFNGRLKEKSSGLGLFLARETADKLGHRLEVKSRLGEGSSFCIVFKKNSSVVF